MYSPVRAFCTRPWIVAVPASAAPAGAISKANAAASSARRVFLFIGVGGVVDGAFLNDHREAVAPDVARAITESALVREHARTASNSNFATPASSHPHRMEP